MKYTLITLAFCILFFGAGCGKKTADNFKVDLNADCAKADYPFACFLDKTTAAKDPNLCNDAGSKRITCISAYEELLETEVDCNTLQDPSFQSECQQYRASQSTPSQNPTTSTEVERSIDSEYMNN